MTNAPQMQTKLQWTLGDRLGKALKVAGVPNSEMAQILGVSRNTVTNYVSDRTPIRDGSIRLWAVRTGISFEELKFGTPSSPETPGGGASGPRYFMSPVSGSNRRPPLYKVVGSGGRVGFEWPDEGSEPAKAA